jgi:hypothetical protein
MLFSNGFMMFKDRERGELVCKTRKKEASLSRYPALYLLTMELGSHRFIAATFAH